MPWTVADVDSHSKGLTDKQKATWVKIANAALASCEKSGGSHCDASAIRQANSVVGKMKEAETVAEDATKLTVLLEAGRVLSAKHETCIRNAKTELDTVLAALDKVGKDGAGMMDEALSEAERSFNDIEAALRAAIPELQPSGPDKYDGGYLVDCFDGVCIYQGRREAGSIGRNGKYYRRSYTIDTAGKVTLGKAEEVTRRVVYDVTPQLGEAATKENDGSVLLVENCGFSVEDVALLEAATPTNEVKPLLKLIGVGWGQKGYYSAEVLKRDGPKAFPAGTRNGWNHMTESEEAERPEGNVDYLASVTTEPAKFLEGAAAPAGAGLYARAKVFSDYAQKIKEKGPYIGQSIRARGDLKEGEAEGRSGMIVTRIAPSLFNTSDYVTVAGAGGKVLLSESARTAGPQQEGSNMSANGAPVGAATNPPTPGSETTIVESLQFQINGLKTGNSNLSTQLTEARTRAADEKAALLVEKQDLASKLATLQAGNLARTLCEAAGLPGELVADVLEQVPMILHPQLREGKYDEEAMKPLIEKQIRSKTDLWARVNRSGQVNGMGGGSGPNVTLEEAQKRLANAYGSSGLDGSVANIAVKGGRF